MKPRWFSITNWNKIDVFNNTFGSFDSMHLDHPSEEEEAACSLHHNSFTQLASDSFKSISEKCQFTEILFKQFCACDFVDEWLSKHFKKPYDRKKLRKESVCSLNPSETKTKCLEMQTMKFSEYHHEFCIKTGRCERVKNKVNRIDAKFIDPKTLTDEIDWWDYKDHIIIIGVSSFLVIFCLLCAVKLARKPKRDIDYARGFENTELNVQLNPSDGPPSYQVSINQDFVIIKRTLDLMKEKQPKEKFELVDFNTKRLLYDHIDEYEKVKVIGDIVQTISECENTGEDFVAFTDILYKYLAADAIPRNEGLYAEPAMMLAHRNETITVVQSKPKNENIYAEPIVAPAIASAGQQGKIIATEIPIMTANYSSPIDNNSNRNNMYSEPVMMEQKIGKFRDDYNFHKNSWCDVLCLGSSTFKPKVVTPYAISQTLDVPSSSHNLPDILGRPGTSNEPFRINRSPTSNRLIPEYTIPSTSHKIPIRVTKDNLEDWSDEHTEGSTNSNTSSYSGSSKQTVKIDDIIQ